MGDQTPMLPPRSPPSPRWRPGAGPGRLGRRSHKQLMNRNSLPAHMCQTAPPTPSGARSRAMIPPLWNTSSVCQQGRLERPRWPSEGGTGQRSSGIHDSSEPSGPCGNGSAETGTSHQQHQAPAAAKMASAVLRWICKSHRGPPRRPGPRVLLLLDPGPGSTRTISPRSRSQLPIPVVSFDIHRGASCGGGGGNSGGNGGGGSVLDPEPKKHGQNLGRTGGCFAEISELLPGERGPPRGARCSLTIRRLKRAEGRAARQSSPPH
ncbi:hypothetical protein CRUP_017547 [Coryphaenoides rupestris]|nr:hypothetical protein CRUP_017547 [Coryphaenoides rupestris]